MHACLLAWNSYRYIISRCVFIQDGVWEKIKEKQEELDSDNSEDVSDQ